MRKELWKKFEQKISNIEIIKETGLNPTIVRWEFEQFLKFRDLDPYVLHKNAMNYLSVRIDKYPDCKEIADSYRLLTEIYNAKGYLANDEFSELLRLLMDIGRQMGIDAVAFQHVRAPKGWNRPMCCNCGKPLGGLVANPDSGLGKRALQSVSRFGHHECAKKNEPANVTTSSTSHH